MQTPAHDRLLDRRAVETMTCLPTASLYELMRHPDPTIRFPGSIRISESRVRWSLQAVNEWIERQKARSATHAA